MSRKQPNPSPPVGVRRPAPPAPGQLQRSQRIVSDIARVEGKYSGRAALLGELQDFVAYWRKAKGGEAPDRIHVERKKLDGLREMAKREKIELADALSFNDIPLVLV